MKLRLDKEVLSELTVDELTGVRVAAAVLTVPIDDCVSFQECPYTDHLRCLITAHPCD